MIKCKIKLTDGSSVDAVLPENTVKELMTFLNAPHGGDTEVKLGDFLLVGKGEIINRHQIVKISVKEVDKEEAKNIEFDENDNTKISGALHKRKNPNGPKRSSQ